MARTPIDLTSKKGWETIEAELPEDFEALAKRHQTLEVQYGEAKLTSGRELLRLILLHAGTDLGLRQTVTLMAESGGPSVSHVTLHKKMRLAAPDLRALVARLAGSSEVSPERWAGYEVVAVDGSSSCGPGAQTTDARVHLQLRLADLEILSAPLEDRSVGESFKRFSWHPGQLAKLLLALVMHRLASGASALFPPEPTEHHDSGVAHDAVAGGQHTLARSQRCAAAA
jgi:hypothetical protein